MFDEIFEVTKALIILALILYLRKAGRKKEFSGRERKDWNLIYRGFILIFIGSILDITDHFESLNRFIAIGKTPIEDILEKLVCYLGGFSMLFLGFIRWMPTIASNMELERSREDATQISKEMETILDTALVGIAFLKERKFVRANSQIEEMFGYKREKLMGETTDILYPTHEDYEDLGRNAYPILSSGGTYSVEKQMRRKDGSLFWCAIMGKAIDPTDVARGSIWILEDIDERVRQSQSLTRERNLLQTAQEIAHIGNWRWDIKGGTLYWSPETFRIFCLEPNSLQPTFETFIQYVYPDDRQRVKEAVSVALKGASYKIEHRIVGKCGTLKIVEERGVVEFDASGAPVFMDGTVLDITDIRKADIEVRKLFQGIEQSPASIVITDPNGTIEYVNPAFCKITGYTVREAVGQNPRILKSGVQSEGFYKELWDTITSGRTWTGEFCNKKKDGTLYWEASSISPVRDTAGRIVNFIAVKEDITYQKKMNEDLRTAKEVAEEANATKDKFVSLVTHDLKNPITTIRGYVELLRDASLDADTLRDIYKDMMATCNDMSSLIDDVLSISRIKSGALSPANRFIDARKTVSVAVKAFQIAAKEKGVDLRNDVPEGARLFADEKLFPEVLKNLISNAIKFSSPGGVVRMFVPDGERSTIAVSDTGLGISKERADDIFRYEIKTSTPGTSGETGTGMGLPLVRDILTAHGGSIDFKSEAGKGSVFFARLPYVKPVVLIVDDDELIRSLLAAQIRPFDIEVMEAGTGKDALKLIESVMPQLVLLDIKLPDMDGFAVLENIRNLPGGKDLPVIVITGEHDMEMRSRAFGAGADDFIPKPISREELIPRIRRFIC